MPVFLHHEGWQIKPGPVVQGEVAPLPLVPSLSTRNDVGFGMRQQGKVPGVLWAPMGTLCLPWKWCHGSVCAPETAIIVL